MCDICVMNRVKERMLSRRDFFKGTAAMAVGAAAVGGVTATPALAMAMAGSSI
jgi:secreted PhoX family phosphatase